MFGHIDKSLGCIAKSVTDDDGSTLIGFVTRRYQDGAVALAGGDVAAAAAAAAAHLEFEVVGPEMTAVVGGDEDSAIAR